MKRYQLQQMTDGELANLCRRNPLCQDDALETCSRIFDSVAQSGDEAVRGWTLKFDGADLRNLRVAPEEIRDARRHLPHQVEEAMLRAASNIGRFHSRQRLPRERIEVEEGIVCWRESRAISKVGLYVPSGTAPLPSSVLMLGVPAQLAGCPTVALCVPPRSDGSVAPEVLAAADIVGIDQIYRVGGAQAIAALTIGTDTIPRVDKIFGPGNRWVTAAKMLAFRYGVDIDLPAGPSEVLVVADSQADPAFVAADLLAQAEHGSDSQAVLATDSPELADRAVQEVERQLQLLPRREFASQAMAGSYAMLTESLEESIRFSNIYAPEHLIVHASDPHACLDRIESAGSVFLGAWSPEVAGDYASGTNHTLPTSGAARAFSGVSLDSFLKKITFQELTPQGLMSLAPTLERLAEIEGLEAHRRAVAVRTERLSQEA